MTLQTLIEISRIRDLDAAALIRLEAARLRQRAYDEELERMVAKKTVSHELLERTCSIETAALLGGDHVRQRTFFQLAHTLSGNAELSTCLCQGERGLHEVAQLDDFGLFFVQALHLRAHQLRGFDLNIQLSDYAFRGVLIGLHLFHDVAEIKRHMAAVVEPDSPIDMLDVDVETGRKTLGFRHRQVLWDPQAIDLAEHLHQIPVVWDADDVPLPDFLAGHFAHDAAVSV